MVKTQSIITLKQVVHIVTTMFEIAKAYAIVVTGPIEA
jgi:hypothetical protein